MVSCLLLATYTLPFATTGTLLALPPVFGHVPAVPSNNLVSVLLPPGGFAEKAKSDMLAGLEFSGRDTAHMIPLFEWSDETLVKNPGSCPLPNEGDVASFTSVTDGEVSTFHTLTC